MPMRNPPHPGEHVKYDCLESLGLTVTRAAEILGISRVALSNLTNGKTGISPEMAVRLAKAFGSTAEGWLRLQMYYDLAQVEKKADSIRINRRLLPEVSSTEERPAS